jgi:hypothetical protein
MKPKKFAQNTKANPVPMGNMPMPGKMPMMNSMMPKMKKPQKKGN